MMAVSPNTIKNGWNCFLRQDYEEALRSAFSVFSSKQLDVGSHKWPSNIELHKPGLDNSGQVDALELLVASACALGKEHDALQLLSRVIGLPVEWWEIVEPLSAGSTGAVQHSQLQKFVDAQARIVELMRNHSNKTLDWQDATTPAEAEELKLSFVFAYLLASRFELNPMDLLSHRLRELWEAYYTATVGFGHQLGHGGDGILLFGSLESSNQHRLRILYTRSLVAAEYPLRAFALFRATYPCFFEGNDICGQPVQYAMPNLMSLSAINAPCVDSLWLCLTMAADRLHVTEWKVFATELLLTKFGGGTKCLDNVEVLADTLISRPAHLIGENYHATLGVLQASDGVTQAKRLASALLERVNDSLDPVKHHLQAVVFRVTDCWGFADKNVPRNLIERSDRISRPRVLSGLPDIALLTSLKKHDFVDGYLGARRDRFLPEKTLVGEDRFLLSRIQFARDCWGAGRKSEASEAIEGWSFELKSPELESRLDDLWNATVTSSQTSTAIPQFCLNLATLLRIAEYEGKKDFVARCRNSRCVTGTLSSIRVDEWRRSMHPVHLAYSLSACVECLQSTSNEFAKICEAAIGEILSQLNDSTLSAYDRILIRSTALQLRSVLIGTAANSDMDSSAQVVSDAKLLTWIELLGDLDYPDKDNFDRRFLNRKMAQECIVPPNSFGTNTTHEYETNVPSFANFSFSVEEPTSAETIDCSEDLTFSLYQSPESSKSNLERAIAHCLGSNGIWVKTLFDSDGRICWWALASADSCRELKCLAKGKSSCPDAYRRIELETEILDASVEAVYWRAKLWEQDADPPKPTRSYPAAIESCFALIDKFVYRYENSAAFGSASRENAFKQANDAIESWKSGMKGTLPNCRELAGRLLAAYRCRMDAKSTSRLTHGWRTISRSLFPQRRLASKGESNQVRKFVDNSLNAACRIHRERIAEEFDLSPLSSFIKSTKWNLIFSLDGPLTSCPVEWLKIDEDLLYHVVDSCTNTFSIRKSIELAASDCEAKSSNEILFAAWEPEELQRAKPWLVELNNALHKLAKEKQWKCRSALDSPSATRELIENTLNVVPFSLVIVAGHGVARIDAEEGYLYGVEVSHVAGKKSEWRGGGDFRAAELVIVCSCVVGRLLDDNQGSVRGVYSNLLSNGAHSFCGARWAVDCEYAFKLTHRLAGALLDQAHSEDFIGHFRLAQLVNRVRQDFLREYPDSIHALSAFSHWGIARQNLMRTKNHELA